MVNQDTVRQVVAKFLSEIPPEKGWWYRQPNLRPDSSSIKDDNHPDHIMPHFGTVFGLTEREAAFILVQMGCLSDGGTSTKINRKGWDNLAGEFMINKHVEIQKTQINNAKKYYIHLGQLPAEICNPMKIYKAWKKNKKGLFPLSSVGKRRDRKEVTLALVSMLRESDILDMFLGMVGENTGSESGQNITDVLVESEDQESGDLSKDDEDDEEVNNNIQHWKADAGPVANRSEYPLLHLFGISADNQQTLQALAEEIVKAQKNNGSLPSGVKDAISTNNKLYA